jgi:hypothetical protein
MDRFIYYISLPDFFINKIFFKKITRLTNFEIYEKYYFQRLICYFRPSDTFAIYSYFIIMLYKVLF